jgi:hypothetical protein
VIRKKVKCILSAALAGAILVVSSGAWAQTTSFAGTWVFDKEKSTGQPALPAVAGSEGTAATAESNLFGGGSRKVDIFRLVITQDADKIILLDGGVTVTYKLDGSTENINPRPGYPKGKAEWEGGSLVLSTKEEVYIGNYQYAPHTNRAKYSLSDNVLTIDRTETFTNGKSTTTHLVYNRSPT